MPFLKAYDAQFKISNEEYAWGDETPEFSVGREVYNSAHILNEFLSRKHFSIKQNLGGGYSLIDCGTRNGTFLNGKKLDSGMELSIIDGDKINAGGDHGVNFVFQSGKRISEPNIHSMALEPVSETPAINQFVIKHPDLAASSGNSKEPVEPVLFRLVSSPETARTDSNAQNLMPVSATSMAGVESNAAPDVKQEPAPANKPNLWNSFSPARKVLNGCGCLFLASVMILGTYAFISPHVKPSTESLIDAIKEENVSLDKIDTLIKAGVDVNGESKREMREGLTPLIAALEREDQNPEIVKLLLRAGVYPNKICAYGGRPIVRALKIETIKALIEAGADVNLKDKDGSTALIRAVNKQDITMIRFLLNHGANVNEADSTTTPLINAVWNCTIDRSGEVFNFKPDVNACDTVSCDNIDVFKEILNAKPDVNARDWRGETALFIPCRRGEPSIVEMLINSGADVDLKNKKGETCVSVCRDLRDSLRNEIPEWIEKGYNVNHLTKAINRCQICIDLLSSNRSK